MSNNTKTKLIPLKQWNDLLSTRSLVKDNGLECPKCKGELKDSSNGIAIYTSPIQIGVKCTECSFTGRRYVDSTK